MEFYRLRDALLEIDSSGNPDCLCKTRAKNKGELGSSPLFNLNTQNYEKTTKTILLFMPEESLYDLLRKLFLILLTIIKSFCFVN